MSKERTGERCPTCEHPNPAVEGHSCVEYLMTLLECESNRNRILMQRKMARSFSWMKP